MAGDGMAPFRHDRFEPNRQNKHIIPHLEAELKVKLMCLDQR